MKHVNLNKSNWLLMLFALLLIAPTTLAKVRLPKLVSDKMVLQRDVELNIWGWASAGEKVTVRFNGAYYETEANSNGEWSVLLPPQKAGGPYLLEVNELKVRDVLVGDVWLCSGQSNQETPIVRLVDKFPEINVSNNHMIRHYKVPTQETTDGVQQEIAGNAVWHSGVASEVLNWTALAYFYAQEAYAKTKVPQGMLVSSLGGSAIESWVSQEHLKEFPRLLLDKDAIAAANDARIDKGAGRWQAFDLNDADWQTMEMPGTWRENGVNVQGVVWMRKEFQAPASMDGRHARLYMGTMVDSDSVFVNGHFVGHTGYQYPPRNYQIPAGILRAGRNVITVRLTCNAPGGGFVKDKPYRIVGDAAEISLEGTWKYKVGQSMQGMRGAGRNMAQRSTPGSGLYNGMIYPIRNYKVSGCIWYQGESNSGRGHEYDELLTALITNWRELWQDADMPFLLVQLPNFMEKHAQPTESGWAGIREAQLKVAKTVANTAMATTYDVGEWNDIHPLDKKSVAQRLFLGARKLVYGEKVQASGPIYKEMKVEGNKAIITFTEVGGGLKCKGDKLKHFAVAGADKKFYWADAVIRGNKVIVTCKEVAEPVAVRYAWADNPDDANLMNKEGLLASPFRTDEW